MENQHGKSIPAEAVGVRKCQQDITNYKGDNSDLLHHNHQQRAFIKLWSRRVLTSLTCIVALIRPLASASGIDKFFIRKFSNLPGSRRIDPKRISVTEIFSLYFLNTLYIQPNRISVTEKNYFLIHCIYSQIEYMFCSIRPLGLNYYFTWSVYLRWIVKKCQNTTQHMADEDTDLKHFWKNQSWRLNRQ